jgi:FkbM family methyltransferase
VSFIDSLSRSLLKRWLQWKLQKLPGGWRVATTLARNQGSASVRIDGLPPVYLDLRGFDLLEISLLLASPKEPEFEKEDRALFRKLVRPGNIVYDIGANLGYHTALFGALAGPAGRVFAFEPQPGLLPNLRKTVNGIPNAALWECALSDQDGEVTFHIPEHGYHMLASLGDPGVRSRPVVCQALRLDGLQASGKIAAPDFIKIDVEGAEPLVFRGARQILNKPNAPLIFFEQWSDAAKRLGFGATEAAEILLSAAAARYGLYEVTGEQLRLLRVNNVAKGNLLAVPEARREEINSLF